MPKYLVRDIANIVNGKLFGDGNTEICYLLTDSRRVASASRTLFFAIKGERHNGHLYIRSLYNLGVQNFVVNELPGDISQYSGANFIVTGDTIHALQQLAAHHRGQFDIPVVGITGSNGKTIVKEWLVDLLQPEKHVVRSPKSYNSQIGVPLSVWLLDNMYDIAVFEAGISGVGEMDKLQKIIVPDYGIFTTIGEAHQEGFQNIEQKIDEKLKLFKNSKLLVYCKDHVLIDKQVKANFKQNPQGLFTWSKNWNADVKITSIVKTNGITHIHGLLQGKEKMEIKIPFTDDASIENAVHVWVFSLALGYYNTAASIKMENLHPVAMRLELKKGINNCTIINDSYNSDLTSLQIALDFLGQQNQHRQKIVILSDILQSGREKDELYGAIAHLFEQKKINQLIGIGTDIASHRSTFKIKSNFHDTTRQFLSVFHGYNFHDAAILIKGARNFAFEQISQILESKVHKTQLEINLDALVHNLNFYRSKLNPSTKIMVMVKAFSYGSGSYEIANLLQFQRVDYLGVAFADEGIALREAGITLPILVLNTEENSFDPIIKHNLEPEIYNLEGLIKFYEAVKGHGLTGYPIHIKLDTGMHRLGFMKGDMHGLCNKIKECTNLKVISVLSHLAASGEPTHDAFTNQQIRLFEELSSLFIKELGYPVIRHISNSTGIERFPSSQYEMVRLGIGLYGVSEVNQQKLKNVGTLKSYISQIKNLPPTETVGYGRKGKINKPTVIAVVPIGYADGLSRKMGNGIGKFMVNGKFAPIIGDICMDMCMIDITNTGAREKDEVIVFGENFTISDMASLLGTIPYEVLTGISGRVKRVYYQE